MRTVGTIETPEYGAALRARMLGHTLDDAQAAVLERGRVEARFPAHRYPLPLTFAERITGADGVGFDAPDPEPAVRRREQRDDSLREAVTDAGWCPCRPVRDYPPT